MSDEQKHPLTRSAIVKMSELPLISVVVPVYNDAKYLDRCLDSLINQTWSQLEILLVDDGSTDESGDLCDSYSHKDGRIHVFHKVNGGSSSARNYGLMKATGDYIGFVDADDWCETDMFEYMIGLIQSKDGDCAQVRIKQCSDYSKQISPSSETICVFEGKEILQHCLNEAISGTDAFSLQRCLFKSSVLEGRLFREGKLNEDVDYKYLAFKSCHRLIESNQVKYFYFQEGSSNSRGGLKKADFDLYEAGDLIQKYTENETYGTIADLGRAKRARTPLSLLCKIAYFGIADADIPKNATIKQLKAELKENKEILMLSPMAKSRKLLTCLFCINVPCTIFLVRLAKKIGVLS